MQQLQATSRGMLSQGCCEDNTRQHTQIQYQICPALVKGMDIELDTLLVPNKINTVISSGALGSTLLSILICYHFSTHPIHCPPLPYVSRSSQTSCLFTSNLPVVLDFLTSPLSTQVKQSTPGSRFSLTTAGGFSSSLSGLTPSYSQLCQCPRSNRFRGTDSGYPSSKMTDESEDQILSL